MNKFGHKGSVSEKDFMIHILNYLPKENIVILHGFENRLTATGDDALTIDSIRKKWITGTRELVKKAKKTKKKKFWVHKINNTNSSAVDVESMATNLVIGDALKIKMKEKKG